MAWAGPTQLWHKQRCIIIHYFSCLPFFIFDRFPKMKRLRPSKAVSCSQCRKSKVKCDKEFPCSRWVTIFMMNPCLFIPRGGCVHIIFIIIGWLVSASRCPVCCCVTDWHVKKRWFWRGIFRSSWAVHLAAYTHYTLHSIHWLMIYWIPPIMLYT